MAQSKGCRCGVVDEDVVVTPWFYDKDIFAAAGLDPDRTPETFGEWLDMMDRIKAAGYTPIAWAGAGASGEQYWEWLSRTDFHSIYRDPVEEMDMTEQPGFTTGLLTFQDQSTVTFYGPVFADYVLASIPLVVVFLFCMKYYITGITSGALKIWS